MPCDNSHPGSQPVIHHHLASSEEASSVSRTSLGGRLKTHSPCGHCSATWPHLESLGPAAPLTLYVFSVPETPVPRADHPPSRQVGLGRRRTWQALGGLITSFACQSRIGLVASTEGLSVFGRLRAGVLSIALQPPVDDGHG